MYICIQHILVKYQQLSTALYESSSSTDNCPHKLTCMSRLLSSTRLMNLLLTFNEMLVNIIYISTSIYLEDYCCNEDVTYTVPEKSLSTP